MEIASIKYMLPRLIGMGAALGRQGGGAGLKTEVPVKRSLSWPAENLRIESVLLIRNLRHWYPDVRISVKCGRRMKSR
ncbi:MAG: hypothetical protein WCD89_26575 [Anaerocolumna sp.]